MPKLTPFPVEQSIKVAQDILADVFATHEAFLAFRAYAVRKDHSKAFAQFRPLFQVLNPSTFATFIVSLYKLGEPKTDRVTINLLLEQAKEAKIIPDSEYAQLATKATAAKKTWEKVNVLRNRMIAHQSLSQEAEAVFKEADVTLTDLEALASEYLGIVNTLAGHAGLKEYKVGEHLDPLHANVMAFLAKLNAD